MTIEVRDIEKVGEQLYNVLDKVKELDAMREAWLLSVTQNANEQLSEFGRYPSKHQATLEEFESFEDFIDDALNHIQHALDIVTDKLPIYQQRLERGS